MPLNLTLKSAVSFAFPSTITLTHFSGGGKKNFNGSYLNIQNKRFCWLKPNIYASASLPIYWVFTVVEGSRVSRQQPRPAGVQVLHLQSAPSPPGTRVHMFSLYVASSYQACLKTHFLLGKK